MRSQVSAFGRFQYDRLVPWVEVLIDYLREVAPKTTDLYEVLNARTQNPLQAAELFQELASFDGPQARDGFEYRLAMTLGSFAPVSRDRETVRFVAHSLNQV